SEQLDVPSIRQRFRDIQTLLDQIREAPAATVALVNGPAVGAGADLAVSCDYRIASDQANFKFPGSRFGVILGVDQLVRTVGTSAASDILLRNRGLGAIEALRLGLVQQILSVSDFTDFINEL